MSGCPGSVVKVSSAANVFMTLTVNIELLNPPLPSEMVHVKVTSPTKFDAGTYVKPPCSSKTKIPVLGALQSSTLKTSLGPASTLARTPGASTMSGCPGSVEKLSVTASPEVGLLGLDGTEGLGAVGFDGLVGSDGFVGEGKFGFEGLLGFEGLVGFAGF